MKSKVVIRRYTEKDIKRCVAGVAEYIRDGKYGNDYYKGLAFDVDKLRRVLEIHIDDVNFFCNIIVKDDEPVGGMCAYVATPIFSSERFAYDQFLYVLPTFKHLTAVPRLVKSYIAWSKRRNVRFCYLRTSTLYRADSFAKLCKRLGFNHYETGFAMEV